MQAATPRLSYRRDMLLRGDDAPGYHHAERADLSADGTLTIEDEIWTNDDVDDYEWEFHVLADQVPGLVTALGGTTCSLSSRRTAEVTGHPIRAA